jgi:hypothetical protein
LTGEFERFSKIGIERMVSCCSDKKAVSDTEIEKILQETDSLSKNLEFHTKLKTAGYESMDPRFFKAFQDKAFGIATEIASFSNDRDVINTILNDKSKCKDINKELLVLSGMLLLERGRPLPNVSDNIDSLWRVWPYALMGEMKAHEYKSACSELSKILGLSEANIKATIGILKKEELLIEVKHVTVYNTSCCPGYEERETIYVVLTPVGEQVAKFINSAQWHGKKLDQLNVDITAMLRKHKEDVAEASLVYGRATIDDA